MVGSLRGRKSLGIIGALIRNGKRIFSFLRHALKILGYGNDGLSYPPYPDAAIIRYCHSRSTYDRIQAHFFALSAFVPALQRWVEGKFIVGFQTKTTSKLAAWMGLLNVDSLLRYRNPRMCTGIPTPPVGILSLMARHESTTRWQQPGRGCLSAVVFPTPELLHAQNP